MTGLAAAHADRIASRLTAVARTEPGRVYVFEYLVAALAEHDLLGVLERAAGRTEQFLEEERLRRPGGGS